MGQRLSKVLIALLFSSTLVHADDRLMQKLEKMEKELAALKAEVATLKAQQLSATTTDLNTSEDAPEVSDLAINSFSDKLSHTGMNFLEKTSVNNLTEVNKEFDNVKEELSELNKKTNGNGLKFDVDFRTSVDNLGYKMADGSTQKNNALLSNRLWLNMGYAETNNLTFVGQLAYNKIFGQRMMGTASAGADGFDWISAESAQDDTLRVRSAYFLYRNDTLGTATIPWAFSLGRRPSTNGHLVRFRDDDHIASPLAHTVNLEFDGASAKFNTETLTKLDGSYLKFCVGRGLSQAQSRFSPTPYATQGISNNTSNMVGVIVVPYDHKQYSAGLQYTYANNLIDMNQSTPAITTTTVGGLHTATAFAMFNAVGNEWSGILNDTLFFISGAVSKTQPDEGKSMLGSTQSQSGYSYWIGAQFPSLISEEGRWGVEFNHGSKYWRPMTYSEDTLIGSKIAARGNAYEVYFTEPLVDDILTFQLRYTYIDYRYSGSNGFFGDSGTPTAISSGMTNSASTVSKAHDIRAYFRYKF